ncbi:autophagy-related protein 13-domain-containing protein [Dichotomocladium elegans]|nr:autophagy-related protein 13-domain-containing protein [Dichotomocladium elegans]
MNFPGNPPASNTSTSQAGPRSYQSTPVVPLGPSSSTSSNSRNSKLEHIIQNYYTKTAQVIVQARVDFDKEQNIKRSSSSIASSSDKAKSKLNKWFNIATQDAEGLKEDLKFWRSRVLQSVDEEIPPLVLEIYLDTSDLTPTQSLMIADDRSRYNKVELRYPEDRILLERWTLSLNHPLPDSFVDLPSLYKRSIIFFRSLYSFVRLLPAYELQRRVRQFGAPNGISLGYRMTPIATYDESEMPLDKSIVDGDGHDLQAYGFPDVITPLGTFRLQVLYRKNCDFRIEDSSEQDLSARMLDLNEHFFTPTMDKHRLEQRPRSVYSFDDQEVRDSGTLRMVHV